MKRLGTTEKRPGTLEMSPELRTVQHLMPMSDEDRARLTADIAENGIRHPLIVYHHDGKNLVLAGWHRREIAAELGIASVPVEMVEASPKERREFCIKENLARRHLTASQKENLVRYLIGENPKASALSLSKKAGVSDKTISRVKREMVRRSEIPNVETVKDSKGREQPAQKPRPSTPRPPKRANMTAELVDYIGRLATKAERMHTRALKMTDKHAAAEERAVARTLAKVAAELERIISG